MYFIFSTLECASSQNFDNGLICGIIGTLVLFFAICLFFTLFEYICKKIDNYNKLKDKVIETEKKVKNIEKKLGGK